jgi:hypothetical protein
MKIFIDINVNQTVKNKYFFLQSQVALIELAEGNVEQTFHFDIFVICITHSIITASTARRQITASAISQFSPGVILMSPVVLILRLATCISPCLFLL